MGLSKFLTESLMIEGIRRPPTPAELLAADRFMRLFLVTVDALGEFQAVIAPGKPLRERPGMNVSVGNYAAPEGGPNILRRLQSIVRRANTNENPWKTHIAFEMLHPYMDGNGRTGRILWAWQMKATGRDPFALPFLHRFYYQTLGAQR